MFSGDIMTIESMTFLKATIDAWAINAKWQKESARPSDGESADMYHHWEAQEIAFRRMQELLEKAGVK